MSEAPDMKFYPSPIFGHVITGGVEGDTMFLDCSCAQWHTELTHEPGVPPEDPRHLLNVMQTLADSGMGHVREVVRANIAAAEDATDEGR